MTYVQWSCLCDCICLFRSWSGKVGMEFLSAVSLVFIDLGPLLKVRE